MTTMHFRKVETTLVFILEKQRMYRYLHVVHSLQMKHHYYCKEQPFPKEMKETAQF